MSAKIVCGLGNPGREYEQTRHNIGFLVLDQFWERLRDLNPGLSPTWREKFNSLYAECSYNGHKLLLVKPQGFMNRSGAPLAEWINFYKVELSDLVVVHDELDITLGTIRLKTGGGHGGHNGIRSLLQNLADASFTRLRVGIGRPQGKDSTDASVKRDMSSWVLGKFDPDEKKNLAAIVDRACDALFECIDNGLLVAQNKFN